MRKRYRFKGRVQGVGFRYSAYTEGRLLNLTVWVKNLSDGSVEMEVQGPAEKIEALIQHLSGQIYISIDSMEAESITEIEEREFEIR